MASGRAAKRLELLREAVPKISRVLVLSYRVDPIAAPQLKELEVAAASLGVMVRNIRTADDMPAAFDAGARGALKAYLRQPKTYSLLRANEWSNWRSNTNCRDCILTG
jgi:putative ABC transport system substrate-binding protein